MAERKSVLITGATRGIGRAIALELADRWHILVGGTRHDSVDAFVTELPSAEPFVADLTDPDAVRTAVERISRLDAVVHSAGGLSVGPIAELSRQEWRDLFEINVVAIADLTALLLPILRASHGHVVTINSGAGLHTRAGMALYAATKHALVAFTDGLRDEERGMVRVTSVHPGQVATDMQDRLGNTYQPERYLVPSDVAAAVALALEARPEANIDMVSVRPAH